MWLKGYYGAKCMQTNSRKTAKKINCVSVPLGSTTAPNFSESAKEKVAGKGERERHYRRKTTKAPPNLSFGAVGDN